MASNWRPASIPLTGGLNTSVNPKRLEPGQFSQLDNAVFDGEGAPGKRHGSTGEPVYSATPGSAPAVDDRFWVNGYGYATIGSLSRLTNGPGETGSVRSLFTRDQDLLAHDGTSFMARYEDLADGWKTIPTGTAATGASGRKSVVHLPSLEAQTSQPLTMSTNFSSVDMAWGAELILTVWAEPSSNMVYASMRDRETGSYLYHRKSVLGISFASGSATMYLRAHYVPGSGGTVGYFVVAQADSTSDDLAVSTILETTPDTWTTTVITTSEWGSGLDIRVHGGYAWVAWLSTTNVLHVSRVDEFAAVTDYLPSLGATPDTPGPVALAFHPDGRPMLLFMVDSAGSWNLQCSVFSADFAARTQGPTTLNAVVMTKNAAATVTGEWRYLSPGTVSIRVFWTGEQSSTLRTFFCSLENTTVVRPVDSDVSSIRISGQAFRTGDTVGVLCTQTGAPFGGSVIFRQHFVMYWDDGGDDSSGHGRTVPCASWGRGATFPQSLGLVFTMAPLPGEDSVNPVKFGTMALLAKSVDVANRLSATPSLLDFGATIRFAQAGRATYMSGAVVKEYDGLSVHEASFLSYPVPILTASAAGGALVAGAVYTYRVYLVSRNHQGEVTRSAAITQTVTLGGGDNRVVITLPHQFLCTRPNAYWEIYRSQANGSVLTLVDVFNGTLGFLSRNVDATYNDVTSDVTIADNPIDPIPVAGVGGVGVLDSVAPPACSIIAMGKDRLWFADGPDLYPGQVAYSRFFDPGEAVSWNEGLVAETDRTSRVTGLGFMGDWVVILARTKSHYLAGDGPSNLGQGDFFPARLIVSDLGALSPESVLLTPLGLVFQSPQGVRVLGPGGSLLSNQTGHIGSEVDASFDGQTVLGSCVVPEQGHARWLLGDGTQMVWDYTVNRWTRWTGYHVTPELGETAGLVYIAGGSVVSAESEVWTEDTSVFTDAGHPYRWIASMGWISPHGPLSWGRLRRWALEGDARGACTMKIFIDYDFSLAKRQRYTWRTSTLSTRPDGQTYDHDPAGWGDEASWGAGPVWGGDTADGGAFPSNVRFNRSQATSFRMTFTDDEEPNDTFALRMLSIEFSPKAGLTRAGGRNI